MHFYFHIVSPSNASYMGRSDLEAYFIFHAANSVASHLTAAAADAQFEFFEKELKGTTEQKPRWKRALEAIEESLGEAMGKLYVEKYFDATAKTRALRVVEAVRDALRERLGEVDWMEPNTKSEV